MRVGKQMKNSVIVALAIQWGAPFAGALLGGWLLVSLLIPKLGLGEVDRIRQLSLHIRERMEAAGPDTELPSLTILLGDSITREGVDADALEASWREMTPTPPGVIENWAVSGCSLVEQRVQLSLALRAKPEIVVFALGPSSLSQLQDMPLDKAYAYAYGGFCENNSWAEILPEDAGLSSPALASLNAPRWRQHLHFRTAPKSWLNQRLRGVVKGKDAVVVADDWRTPFYMQGSVSEKQLAWHIQLIEGWWTKDRMEMVSAGEAILRQLGERTRAAGAAPVFVMAPIHPRLRAAAEASWRQTRPAIHRVAGELGIALIDATQTLDVEQFADALHPNAAGRQRYSEQLAADLQRPTMTARANKQARATQRR